MDLIDYFFCFYTISYYNRMHMHKVLKLVNLMPILIVAVPPFMPYALLRVTLKQIFKPCNSPLTASKGSEYDRNNQKYNIC